MASTSNDLPPCTARENWAWSCIYAAGLFQKALTVAVGIALGIPLVAPQMTTVPIPTLTDMLMTAGGVVIPYFLSVWVISYVRCTWADELYAARRARATTPAVASDPQAPKPEAPAPC